MGKKKQRVQVVDDIHVPTSETREQVCKLVACGLTPSEIAFFFGCMEHEVKEHYERELEHGMALVTGLVGGAMLKNALGGDTNAQRAFLQMRARWTVPQHVELTGKDGGPIQVEARKQTIQRVLALFKPGSKEEVPAAGAQDVPVG